MRQSEKQRLWKLNHYNENKNFYISKQTERRKQIKEFLDGFKKDGCIICSESDVACLDFHHINPNEKEDTLTVAIKNKWGEERIMKEIKKCVVLCSNCHRKIHYYNITHEELKISSNGLIR